MKKILLTAGSRLPVKYIHALQQQGAQAEIAKGVLEVESFDGLVLCGGGDPEPTLFGQKKSGQLWNRADAGSAGAVLYSFVFKGQ
ncbi:MAG: hypothetical protein IJN34_00430 [Clostridia bacterium]|nr:hypothetical protein [Clostridia bacterium]